MATVRHLGLFPWCLFRDEEHLRTTYSYVSDETWENNIKHYDNLKTSVDLAMALYWRVKKWNITGTQTLDIEDNPEYEVPFEFNFQRDCTSEKELVCKSVFEAIGGTNFFSPLPLIPPASEFLYQAPGFINDYPAVCSFQIPSTGVFGEVGAKTPFGGHYIKNEDTTWIATHMRFSFTGNDAGGDFEASDAGLSTRIDEAFAELTLLDKKFQWSYWVSRLPIYDLKIEATEYWEYDPKDGLGPIYNKDTGQQMRAFPG